MPSIHQRSFLFLCIIIQFITQLLRNCHQQEVAVEAAVVVVITAAVAVAADYCSFDYWS